MPMKPTLLHDRLLNEGQIQSSYIVQSSVLHIHSVIFLHFAHFSYLVNQRSPNGGNYANSPVNVNVITTTLILHKVHIGNMRLLKQSTRNSSWWSCARPTAHRLAPWFPSFKLSQMQVYVYISSKMRSQIAIKFTAFRSKILSILSLQTCCQIIITMEEKSSDAFFGELTQTHSHLPMYIKPNGSQDILSRVQILAVHIFHPTLHTSPNIYVTDMSSLKPIKDIILLAPLAELRVAKSRSFHR